MAEFTVDLSAEDTKRLFALQRRAGEEDISGNKFAEQLLSGLLYNMHPEPVKDEEIE